MTKTNLVCLSIGWVVGISCYLLYQSTAQVVLFPNGVSADGARYNVPLKDGFFHGFGTAEWPGGSSYEGQFSNGTFHGKGKLKAVDGTIYQAQFDNGNMIGPGEILFSNGDKYVGELKAGAMHGSGRYQTQDFYYIGEFENNRFHGEGKYIERSGAIYEGEFWDGKFHGNGEYRMKDGDRYIGTFRHGNFISGTLKSSYETYEGDFFEFYYHGNGKLTRISGDVYSGKFEYGYLEGVGKIEFSNGDLYEGEMSYGGQDGFGRLIPADREAETIEGYWRNGEYIGKVNEPIATELESITEKMIYNQESLLQKEINKIKVAKAEGKKIFVIGIGGDGRQSVFLNEISKFSSIIKLFDHKRTHSVILANTKEHTDKFPLATNYSIERTIKEVANVIEPKTDVAIVYAASHGDKLGALSLVQPGISISDIGVNNLARYLNETKIKWRIIIVSSCYSGTFIDSLKNNNTIIITASRKDRKSFGCSNDAELTYFGEAFLKQKELLNFDFLSAYEKAIIEIEAREKEEGKEYSIPQIYVGKDIEKFLSEFSK